MPRTRQAKRRTNHLDDVTQDDVDQIASKAFGKKKASKALFLKAIRAHPNSIGKFFEDYPEAIPLQDEMRHAIEGRIIRLGGSPYKTALRAYRFANDPVSLKDRLRSSLDKINGE